MKFTLLLQPRLLQDTVQRADAKSSLGLPATVTRPGLVGGFELPIDVLLKPDFGQIGFTRSAQSRRHPIRLSVSPKRALWAKTLCRDATSTEHEMCVRVVGVSR